MKDKESCSPLIEKILVTGSITWTLRESWALRSDRESGFGLGGIKPLSDLGIVVFKTLLADHPIQLPDCSTLALQFMMGHNQEHHHVYRNSDSSCT